MIDVTTYLRAVGDRLTPIAARLGTMPVGPVNALVAQFTVDVHKPAPFSLALALAGDEEATEPLRPPFSVITTGLQQVTEAIVTDFLRHAADAATAVAGTTDLQTLIVGFVSPAVYPDAVAAAYAKPRRIRGHAVWPVVVDLRTGQVHAFTGRYAPSTGLHDIIRRTIMTTYPPPAALLHPGP